VTENEGSCISQTYLPKLQDNPAQWRGSGDLQGCPAQAAPGMSVGQDRLRDVLCSRPLAGMAVVLIFVEPEVILTRFGIAVCSRRAGEF